MNNKQQHILPFWARICAVGLLYLFIHFTVLLPYLNSDIGIINLTELCDEENEGEKEEIETEKEFEIDTSTVEKVKGLIIPVFIVKTDKESILNGLNSKLIEREKEAISSDEVKGEFLSVGSLENILTSGNWPDKYD